MYIYIYVNIYTFIYLYIYMYRNKKLVYRNQTLAKNTYDCIILNESTHLNKAIYSCVI